jgi:hypothetical protein
MSSFLDHMVSLGKKGWGGGEGDAEIQQHTHCIVVESVKNYAKTSVQCALVSYSPSI